MEEPDFWEDTEGSQKVMKELKMLKDTIQTAEELNRQFEDTDILLEMAEEEEDASLAGEIREGIRRLDEHLEEVRISTLLGGEYDNCDAIVTLHAGAGEQRHVTGIRCCTGCTLGSWSVMVSLWRSWIILTEILRESKT